MTKERKRFREAIRQEVERQIKEFEGWEIDTDFITDVVDILDDRMVKEFRVKKKINPKTYIHSWMNDIIYNWGGLEYFVLTKFDNSSI